MPCLQTVRLVRLEVLADQALGAGSPTTALFSPDTAPVEAENAFLRKPLHNDC
jgi:hypothetical protein